MDIRLWGPVDMKYLARNQKQEKCWRYRQFKQVHADALPRTQTSALDENLRASFALASMGNHVKNEAPEEDAALMRASSSI